jgi:hypothetical protein
MDKLLKFFKLVQDGKFPLNNIAFELFLDIVEWFDKDESRQMRYSPSTLQLLCPLSGDCLYHRQGNEQKQVAVHQI